MKFLHYITEWKHLKLKNIILNEENGNLAMDNMLLERMNKAYEIENFKSGRKIAKLKSERDHLVEAFNLQAGKKVSGFELIDGRTPEIEKILGNLDGEPGVVAIGSQSINPKTKKAS